MLHKAHRPPVCPGHRWPRTRVWKEQGQLSGHVVEKPKASRGMGSTQTHRGTDVVAEATGSRMALWVSWALSPLYPPPGHTGRSWGSGSKIEAAEASRIR